MIVYALVGPSGTGKSHHASMLAFKNNIPLILDDGLLIENNRVIAGRSAKRELTKIGAAKRALLTDPEHAESLRKKIIEVNPAKILLIGTSDRMVKKVAQRLEISEPHNLIRIDDIVSPEAIQKALKLRKTKNRHVVPLPTFAIKKDFPGYLVSPLRSLFTRSAPEQKKLSVERSIVRPVYSSLGNFFIAENVIISMVSFMCEKMPSVHKINKIKIKNSSKGVNMDLELTFILHENMKKTLSDLQFTIKEYIEFITGFYLSAVNISVVKVEIEEVDE